MAKGDVIVLANGLEQRTSKSGKSRFTIKMHSEPVIFNLDPKALPKEVAPAIARHLQQAIKGITAVASAATIKARKIAAKAFTAGKPWAMKRYAGGRTGPKAPNQSDRLFNDSGRMADSVRASASKDGAWRVNVAANRLSGDPTSVERIYAKLVELVPEFARPELLLQNALLKRTIEKAVEQTRTKLAMGALNAVAELYRTADEALSSDEDAA
jgi:hypothetical protein